MHIIVNLSSMTPIYEQIMEQIKTGIVNGTLEEGMILSSVRNLSKELKISALTVKKAYDNLETEGFTVTVHGKGTFVAATNTQVLKEEQIKEVEKYLFGLITGFGAWVLGSAMEMVCILIQKSETKISELLGTSLLMWSVGLAMIAVMLPFFLKFGQEKGRNIFFAIFGGICGILYVVVKIISQYGIDFSGILNIVFDSKIITISLLVFFGILFLYMFSCRISLGIMENKEF